MPEWESTPESVREHDVLNEPQLFAVLPAGRAGWRSFAGSGVLHSLAITFSLVLPWYFPIVTGKLQRELAVRLVAPKPPRKDPPPPPKVVKIAPPPVRQFVPPPPPKLNALVVPPPPMDLPKVTESKPLPQIAPKTPVIQVPEAPKPAIRTDVLPPAVASSNTAPAAPRTVQTGLLAQSATSGTPARLTAPVKTGLLDNQPQQMAMNRPRTDIQTGAFGAHPVDRAQAATPRTASVGAFDGASRTASNGQPLRGQVVATGFGSTTASTPAAQPARAVRDVAFAAKQESGPAAAQAKAQTAGRLEPVEITSKPKPNYTEEGRQKRIEGEVVIEAVFAAAGQVKPLRVVRALGHGLDEEALRTAAQIRFKPARQDGQPIDQIATVRILFQLAY